MEADRLQFIRIIDKSKKENETKVEKLDYGASEGLEKAKPR